jgi:hypothetical protein
MSPSYLHLPPDEYPPDRDHQPYRAVIVSELETTQEWRNEIAEWLVSTGCLYVVAWGVQCEEWHDTVDWTILERFEFGDIPDENFIMTTWHDKEPLSEAFWFAGQCASHLTVELRETLLIDVSPAPRERDLLTSFAADQVTSDEE